MSCEFESQVHADHDGELDAGGRAVVDAHLRECAACREVLAGLRGVSELLAGAGLGAMPAGLTARLYGTWDRARAARERSVLRIASWMTGVAAAVLVGGLISLSAGGWRSGNDTGRTGGSWESVAIAPPGEVASAEALGGTELVQVAQWQAEDLGGR